MKALHQITGISRQALHQHIHRQSKRLVMEELLCGQALAIRERHPRMGCRTMYDLITDIDLGRDRCEQVLLVKGFSVKRPKSYFKTTQAQYILRFPNLIKGLTIRAINLLWQTDITYYHVPCGAVYYIVFIIDVYSRRIVGHCAHDHMRAEANLLCLKRAITLRQGDDLSKLIHHSDRGGQFIDQRYRDTLSESGIRMSMCETSQENAYTERINGTIKNGYLIGKDITTLAQLRRELNKAVQAYNEEKPHHSLPGRINPVQFENYLKETPDSQHPTLTIYGN